MMALLRGLQGPGSPRVFTQRAKYHTRLPLSPLAKTMSLGTAFGDYRMRTFSRPYRSRVSNLVTNLYKVNS